MISMNKTSCTDYLRHLDEDYQWQRGTKNNKKTLWPMKTNVWFITYRILHTY